MNKKTKHIDVTSGTKPLTKVKVQQWYQEECAKHHGPKEFCTGDQEWLYLGEITNMQGHGVFVNSAGRVFWGYHLEDFEVCQDEDLFIDIDTSKAE